MIYCLEFYKVAVYKSQHEGRLARANTRYKIAKYLIYRGSKENFPTTALKGGMKALPISQLGSIIGA
jgi:hypothetical protein